jgi:glutamate-5-semialdehyde dehydrogenase
MSIEQALIRTQAASRRLLMCSDETMSQILYRIADLTEARMAYIIAQNALDLERMDPKDPKYDRLLLHEKRLKGIADDLRSVADLPSPLGKVLQTIERPNGLYIQKVSVPIGVLGIVYESRPNVTFDVAALCLKTRNAAVLKGSRDAHDSNIAIVALIHEVLAEYDLIDAVYLAPSPRESLADILKADRYIDAIIPRGSQGLIDYVRANATVPVIETGAGIVHTYVDSQADVSMARRIVENAKARRISVCNALDCLIVHRDRLNDLPVLLEDLGIVHQCRVFADAEALVALKGHYPADLLEPAELIHFGTEFLSMQMAVKTVDNLDAALNHIAQFGSKHSEAIVTSDEAAAARFLNEVDAATVYVNASTAFTDGGEFGFGAEIGISTQKLHARGPMALAEMTSYKWLVRGTGQVR